MAHNDLQIIFNNQIIKETFGCCCFFCYNDLIVCCWEL